jgi:hypothetical protein
MDGFDIAESLEAGFDIEENLVRDVLVSGDEGDKLYASLYLLHHGLASRGEVEAIIHDNCDHDDICQAWLLTLEYIGGDVEVLGKAFKSENESELFLGTVANLCPAFIRQDDISLVVQMLTPLQTYNGCLKDDILDVIERLNQRLLT